jgi:anti-sigma factor RsiW
MNCNEARQHWNLYHDSEGDAELHFQVSEHLAICPHCAEWFSQQSRLEALLAEKLRCEPATPELWNHVLTHSGLIQPAPVRRWLWLAGVAACAAMLVVAVLRTGNRSPVQPSSDLAKLTAARHERLVAGEEVPQFESRSDLEVEDYLRKRVSFAVRCPPRKDAGFAVKGAGVCQLAEQPAAYLSGRVDEAPVSIFVLPRDSLAAFPHQQAALVKNKTHRCREGQYAMVLGVIDKNAVLVIGQTEPERLDQVLNAYGTYPDHH